MTNVIICGIGGAMGANVLSLVQAENDMKTVCGVDVNARGNALVPTYTAFNDIKEKADVIIDFSSPSALADELEWAEKNGVAVVIGATGYSKEQIELIKEYSKKIAIFKTGNFSLGINLLVRLVKQAAETLGENFDVEIIERHHNKKADAPSGTALMLAESVNSAFDNSRPYMYGREGAVGKRGNEIGIHAVRGGTIVGEHEVMFAGEDEIITISHSARSKKVFAAGAVRAAHWLAGKPAALYDMNDYFNEI